MFNKICQHSNSIGCLTVRYLNQGDTNLIDQLNLLLTHNRSRDGSINYLGNGTPKANSSWLNQNKIRKIIALWETSSNDNIEMKNQQVVCICTLILGNRTAILELIKTNKNILTNCTIGQHLMSFADDICWNEENIEEIRINVDNNNERAINFYNRRGFSKDSGRQSICKYKKEFCLSMRIDNLPFITPVVTKASKVCKKRKFIE